MYIITTILLLLGCKNDTISENNTSSNQSGVDAEKAVILQTEFFKCRPRYTITTKFTLDKNTDGINSTFVYHNGLSYTKIGAIEELSIPKYTMAYPMSSPFDTIVLRATNLEPPNLIEIVSHNLIDSLNLKISNQSLRIYIYKRISDDYRWDEVIYVSKEFGFMYSFGDFFKTEKKLIYHSDINSKDLNKLIPLLQKNYEQSKLN